MDGWLIGSPTLTRMEMTPSHKKNSRRAFARCSAVVAEAAEAGKVEVEEDVAVGEVVVAEEVATTIAQNAPNVQSLRISPPGQPQER